MRSPIRNLDRATTHQEQFWRIKSSRLEGELDEAKREIELLSKRLKESKAIQCLEIKNTEYIKQSQYSGTQLSRMKEEAEVERLLKEIRKLKNEHVMEIEGKREQIKRISRKLGEMQESNAASKEGMEREIESKYMGEISGYRKKLLQMEDTNKRLQGEKSALMKDLDNLRKDYIKLKVESNQQINQQTQKSNEKHHEKSNEWEQGKHDRLPEQRFQVSSQLKIVVPEQQLSTISHRMHFVEQSKEQSKEQSREQSREQQREQSKEQSREQQREQQQLRRLKREMNQALKREQQGKRALSELKSNWERKERDLEQKVASREQGMRDLKQQMERMLRKLAPLLKQDSDELIPKNRPSLTLLELFLAKYKV